jgi:four helix bundle protein
MSEVQQFEDLIAWQKARELTRAVFGVTQQGALARNFGFVDQIQRASISIMSNIAEGFERGSAAEFHQFLFVAKSSCAEVRSLLYVALDAGYIDESAFVALRGQAAEVGKVVGGLRAAVARRRDEQRKGRPA